MCDFNIYFIIEIVEEFLEKFMEYWNAEAELDSLEYSGFILILFCNK